MRSFQGVKRGVRALLDQVGYTIRRSEQLSPVDIRDQCSDPRYFDYYGGSRPVLIDVSLDRGLGLGWFELGPESRHPWVRAVRAGRDADRPRAAIREVLERYYRVVQPDSAADWLGFEPGEVPALDDEPPWARVWPWEGRDIRTRRNKARAVAAAEAQQWGWQLSIEDGWNSYGPVSAGLVGMEAERLVTLMRSLREDGYRRSDRAGGDIAVAVLWNDEEHWRFRVCGGAHRVAVAAALGYRRLPVRVIQLVRRSEAEIWPNVNAGLFERGRAVELFDRLVAGSRPAMLQRWGDEAS